MRYWGMIILGIGGTAILLGLGVWQVQRLAWKAEILAQIERKILAPAVDIPAQVAPATDDLLSVRGTGRYVGDRTVRVLVSQKIYGAGYRLISAFELTDGRKIMIDRGFTSVRADMPAMPRVRARWWAICNGRKKLTVSPLTMILPRIYGLPEMWPHSPLICRLSQSCWCCATAALAKMRPSHCPK